jgi:hypothetical protein
LFNTAMPLFSDCCLLIILSFSIRGNKKARLFGGGLCISFLFSYTLMPPPCSAGIIIMTTTTIIIIVLWMMTLLILPANILVSCNFKRPNIQPTNYKTKNFTFIFYKGFR